MWVGGLLYPTIRDLHNPLDYPKAHTRWLVLDFDVMSSYSHTGYRRGRRYRCPGMVVGHERTPTPTRRGFVSNETHRPANLAWILPKTSLGVYHCPHRHRAFYGHQPHNRRAKHVADCYIVVKTLTLIIKTFGSHRFLHPSLQSWRVLFRILPVPMVH
jgi:hypothetical protein